jgi:hypothetical protein
MRWCSLGNHMVLPTDYPCAEHPPGPDRAVAGRCSVGHFAAAIWRTPNNGKFYCKDHLREVIRRATWMP